MCLTSFVLHLVSYVLHLTSYISWLFSILNYKQSPYPLNKGKLLSLNIFLFYFKVPQLVFVSFVFCLSSFVFCLSSCVLHLTSYLLPLTSYLLPLTSVGYFQFSITNNPPTPLNKGELLSLNIFLFYFKVPQLVFVSFVLCLSSCVFRLVSFVLHLTSHVFSLSSHLTPKIKFTQKRV